MSSAPRKAAGGSSAIGVAGKATMTSTAAAFAPAETPITSGAASGLRVSPWRTAPARARVTPTPKATSARGSRSSVRMKVWPEPPCPSSVATTSPGVSGYSPRPTETTSAESVSRPEAPTTITARRRVRRRDDTIAV